jgi:hypothetical protein
MIGTIKDRMREANRARIRRFIDPATQHVEDVKADQAYGVILGDGVTLASIENRWVRKKLHRQGKLYRRDRPQSA